MLAALDVAPPAWEKEPTELAIEAGHLVPVIVTGLPTVRWGSEFPGELLGDLARRAELYAAAQRRVRRSAR
jgi:hypothetical protein